MPIIVFGNSKGGAGKTTSAVLLASELAERGAGVTLIDGDPNRPITHWANTPEKPAKLTVKSDVTEDTVIRAIEDAARRTPFVIVDLEGTASMTVGYAMSRANLVIIPTQGSQLDAAQATKTIRLVKKQEEAFRTRIAATVLFTRTSAAIRPRGLQSIEKELLTAGIRMLDTSIHEREAYRAMFSFRRTLSKLDPAQVANLPAAIANARAFTHEVVGLFREAAPPQSAMEVA
jgi:chromosome partitioning protein